jgi:oligoendopeptidase F
MSGATSRISWKTGSSQLFHEKSVTGRAPGTRLFDETMASSPLPSPGEELSLEPTLNKLQDTERRAPAGGRPAHCRRCSGPNPHLHAHHQHLAKDKEISDRWRGFEDVADSRHLANRVEREVVDALVQAVTDAYPRLSHRYYALKARWFGRDALDFWDRNAPCPGWSSARSLDRGA